MDIRNYQSEKPADSDQFSGQGHMKVAEAISNILIFDSSQYIIGVEGDLGAGKSSVIKILEKKIIESGFHVVTFDTDQYQKTLKTALIKIIESKIRGLLDKKDKVGLSRLKKAVETALGKRLEYTKDTNSHISFSTIIFVFFFAVAVLQLKPSLSFLFDLVKELQDINFSSGFLSLILLISPILAFFIMKFFGVETRLGDLLKRNTLDKISEVIDVNREVGAVELKEAFEIFSALIPKENTLLLVIDNIDRVSPSIAREIWSDIEILISLSNERFRILLPYSEEHLAKALEKSSIDETQSGKEFISKRLPVSFSAPPIVTTGWRDQFDTYWSYTLPDISGKEGVKDLIEIWAGKITPRYLKNIVNRIGAKIDSCPESNDDLSGASCAAYLMAVKDGQVTINSFLAEPKSTNSDDSELVDIERKVINTHRILRKYDGDKDNWSKQIAALHFQTSFDIAQSELIIDPIRTAFNSFDIDNLIKISSLFGFEVFFKKQLASTNVADLVRISALLSEDDRGIEIIHDYLVDINHELKDSLYENTDFDEDLVDDYKKLKENGINIDLKIPNYLQNQATNDINKIFRKLKLIKSNENSKEVIDSINSQVKSLEKKVEECYEYYCVTANLPDFIKNPKSDFVVNALFPIIDDIKEWNVREIINELSAKSLTVSACKRQMLLNDKINIFPLILKKIHVGQLQDLESEDLLNSIDIKDKVSLINLLPFESKWYEEQNKNYSQMLVDSIAEMSKSDESDENTVTAFIALCAAAFVNELIPADNITLRQTNGQRNSLSSVDWLASQLEAHPKSQSFIVDYLSTCKFAKILTWSKDNKVGKYFVSSLEELITTSRIDSMNIEPLLLGDYAFIRDNAEKLNSKEILDWMGRWRKYTKAPQTWLKWSDELVNDILEYKPEFLLGQLIECFDSPDITKEQWLQRMKEHHPTIEKFANYFSSGSQLLNYQDSLHQALKDIPIQQHTYDVELVSLFVRLISGYKKHGIRATLTANFFKNNTDLEQRNRVIKYFGSFIDMPKIESDVVEMEVISLLDNAMNQNYQEVKSWLLKQTGWNISEWSADNLGGLSGVFESFPELQEEELTKEVLKRLEELRSAETHLTDEYVKDSETK
ncbi:P-loop NTPase fold protein [Marinomonas primoryensis]|uniref:P-loop containing nucleoside triphosphate hydrolase n=1 Tax=Marinomonas primoryensis TaxID=178399 RepID=A0A859CTD9_9GAMM|nr:P-loop NTPase fold protein [Marinomonas primoryensis]QKK79062.1 P-loop containing nucleoside triphosphate hydrolase [Marinomonas primoryensis]